jgi:hypothetical protein
LGQVDLDDLCLWIGLRDAHRFGEREQDDEGEGRQKERERGPCLLQKSHR